MISGRVIPPCMCLVSEAYDVPIGPVVLILLKFLGFPPSSPDSRSINTEI